MSRNFRFVFAAEEVVYHPESPLQRRRLLWVCTFGRGQPVGPVQRSPPLPTALEVRRVPSARRVRWNRRSQLIRRIMWTRTARWRQPTGAAVPVVGVGRRVGGEPANGREKMERGEAVGKPPVGGGHRERIRRRRGPSGRWSPTGMATGMARGRLGNSVEIVQES